MSATYSDHDNEVWDDIHGMTDDAYSAKYGMCGGCGSNVEKCCGGCKEPVCRVCPDSIAEGWFSPAAVRGLLWIGPAFVVQPRGKGSA